MMNQVKPANTNAYNPTNMPIKALQDPKRETEIIKVIDKPKKEINLKYIVENTPATKVVREYFRRQIENIKSPEAEMFEYEL